MARTALGTASGKTSGTTLTIASIALSAGDTLVVGAGMAVNFVTGATWGTHNLSRASTSQDGGNLGCEGSIWYWYEGTGGTQTLTVTFNGTIGSANGAAIWASKYDGLKNQAPTDTTGNDSSSSSTTVTGGTTLSPSGASWVEVFNMLALGPSSDSSPSASGWTLAQRVGTTGGSASSNVTCNEFYVITGGGGTLLDNGTLATSRNWGTACALFEPGASPVTVALGAGSATATGRSASASLGALSKALGQASSSATGRAVSKSLGGISVALSAGSLTSAGNDVAELGAEPIEAGAAWTRGWDIAVRLPSRPELPSDVTETGNATIMSGSASGFALRSLGSPYFAFTQQDYSYMTVNDGWGGGEDFQLIVRFALHALPVQYASPDEDHVMFAFLDRAIVSAGDLLHIGITPSGAVFAQGYGGPRVASGAGLVVPDGQFHDLILDCTSGGSTLLTLDNRLVADDRGSDGITPTPPHIGQFMLFNGVNGLARTDITISNARWGDENGQVIWDFHEGHGRTTLGGPDQFSPFIVQNFLLTAGWYEPAINGQFTHPWGAVPTNQTADSAFRWELAPNWQRRAKPVPMWTRRAS